MLIAALWIAWRELIAHPWRSLGAAHGIILAAAAAVAGAALSAGVDRALLSGGTGLRVLAAGTERAGAEQASLLAASFDASDVEALRREVAGIERLAPATSLLSMAAAAPNAAHRTVVLGTTPDYFALSGQVLARGRWMTGEELAAGAPVCIAGPALAAQLFATGDPLQATLRVGTMTCPIIGVLAPKGSSAADDLLVMPLATLQRSLLGDPTISSIYFSTRADHPPLVVSHQVEMLMRERRRLGPSAPVDFSVRTAPAFVGSSSSLAERLPPVLAGAAVAGFLLGGLGILLALRASIGERRREIGVWVATGATRAAVALRLTLEAALLSTLGGLLGAALGLALAYAGQRPGGYAAALPVEPLLLVLGAALLVGTAFGALPAYAAGQRSAADLLRRD